MIPVTECRTGAEVRALAARFRAPVKTPIINTLLPEKAFPTKTPPVKNPIVRVTVLDPAVKPILVAVCKEYRLTYRGLLKKGAKLGVARARQDAAYRIRAQLGYSLPHIARILRRDYTTVRHGIVAHALRNYLPVPENTGTSWALRTRGIRR